MTAVIEPDVYIAGLTVGEIFADPTYQRVCDVTRARKMAATWDRRLAGILEVSDRGEDVIPRYAVMDGQHRWAAARSLVDPPPLVANVHTGLSVAEEAALFDQLNRQRKQTNTWDHWKARSAAGNADVTAIEAILAERGLRVDPGPRDGNVSCTAALEKVVKLGGVHLLNDVLGLIVGAWQTRRDGLDAPIIHGLAMVLHHLRDEIDLKRLADTLIDVMPRQVKTQAVSLREMSPGTLPVITAIVIIGLYNKKPGRKIEVTHKTFGGTGLVNSAPKPKDAPSSRHTKARAAARSHMQSPALEQITSERPSKPRSLPTGLPPAHPETDEHADAVADMEGKPVAEIAQALGISERSVRRIQSDLGIGVG